MKKENKNVVIKQCCHSRKSLSGIFHVLNGYVHKRKTSLDNNSYVEDPRLQPSGMTPYFTTTRGFTFIELLVVVLIIGILAAVAVPQYQIAVEKSRATEALANLRTLAQAAETYYLANGTNPPNLSSLDVKVPTSMYFNYQREELSFSARRKDGSYLLAYRHPSVRRSGTSIAFGCGPIATDNANSIAQAKKICQQVGADVNVEGVFWPLIK